MSLRVCPHCARALPPCPHPALTVDGIVLDASGDVVLVRRRFPPPGWALPGGFVELGETVEQAVRREILEETGLVLSDLEQFRTYSDPRRDPRHHSVSVVFTARAIGVPVGGDDASEARCFPLAALPAEMAFDHRLILADFSAQRQRSAAG